MSSRPGKTAPRLLQDFLLYDPGNAENTGQWDILRDAPRWAEAGGTLVPEGSCRHVYIINTSQTKEPPKDSRPDSESLYFASAVCQECRCHVNLVMDYRHDPHKTSPCVNEGNPLHHFVYDDDASKQDAGRREVLSKRGVLHVFKCTAMACPGVLSIIHSPPRVTPEYVTRLTNIDILKSRLQHAQIIEPERCNDLVALPPYEILHVLQAYLQDGLDSPAGSGKTVPAKNKKFLVALGEDCDDMLRSLSFTRTEGGWTIPELALTEASTPDNRSYVEEFFIELQILLSKYPLATTGNLRHFRFNPVLAFPFFERCLAAQNYDKLPLTRRSEASKTEIPEYAVLGALGNFSDSLIIFAYDRQAQCDPMRTSYYFDALSAIANSRTSEDLNMKVALLQSEGHVSQKDLQNAYRDLGAEPVYSDDHILGIFKSMYSDVSPSRQAELRQSLSIIAQSRRSTSLQSAAAQAVETVEQAYEYLGASHEVGDEWISNLFNVKSQDDPASSSTARKALELIADHRNSDALRSVLATGEFQPEMDFEAACTKLGVDPATVPDPLTLHAAVLAFSDDNPWQKEQYELAYARILKGPGDAGNKSQEEEPARAYPVGDWPVGLENIGNTCYLNSLLQYYFSVKPLRELVIQFDEHKVDATLENIRSRKVGGRNVSLKEVKRGQDLAEELRSLFTEMITVASYQVRPTERLAVLALPPPTRRSSSISVAPNRGIGSLNGQPLLGPALPPHLEKDEEQDTSKPDSPKQDIYMQEALNANGNKDGRRSSEITLLLPPTPPNADVSMGGDAVLEMAEIKPEQPSRAPPVPPRPTAKERDTNTKKSVKEDIEFTARQHDVTEAHESVIFQLQCALKSKDATDNGGQTDFLRELFYGTWVYTQGTDNKNDKVEAFLDIKIFAKPTTQHIYTALDVPFELEQTMLDGKRIKRFCTIRKIPPILQIFINRAVYNTETSSQVKNEGLVELDETIYMDRYMESGNPDLLEMRKQSWAWKAELAKREEVLARLLESKGDSEPLPRRLNIIAEFLESVASDEARETLVDVDRSVPEELPGMLRNQARGIQKEIDEIQIRISELQSLLENQFRDLKSHPYALHAVFKHIGGTGGGHYKVYIKDHENNMWRLYNDNRVTEVQDTKEILQQEQTAFTPATAYYVIYVDANKILELTEPLKR
ncbi:cysteine proteinase, partial [Aulographum hederae CBS 113979]